MPIEITMPRLSDTMETGTVIKWHVGEGDPVSSGDVLADVETDKATMEMQTFDDGTVASILIPEGQTTDVGTVIAVLAEEDEEISEVTTKPDPPSSSVATAASPPEQTIVSAPPSTSREESAEGKGKLRISPVARRLADEHKVDLNQIQGSGPGGRIIKRDILSVVETSRETAASIPPSAASGPPSSTIETPSLPETTLAVTPVPVAAMPVPTSLHAHDAPLSNMRQIIARRLVESKTTIPHYQITITFDMDPLLDLRRTLNEQLAPQGVKLSVNDFLVRCCALAMYQNPEFNASWGEDHIAYHGEVNIGVAISLPEERGGGLVVATIHHADQKSLRTISADTKSLAQKARTRGLALEEMADATFTISNLGMFGVEHFTAIINPPNSAILAVGAALETPVVRQGELTVGHEMRATLSLDHRVIDGATGAKYLQTLKQFIENPGTLLV